MPPASLYKFLRFDTESSRSRVREILLSSAIWMPSRLSFNDPFDCCVQYVDRSTESEKLHWLAERYKAENPEAPQSELIKRAARSAERAAARGMELEKVVRGKINEHLDSFGICCLSATRTSVLLWSHYADAHRGLCLEFTSVADGDPIAAAREIKYQDGYPVVDVLKDKDPGRFEKILLRKSIAWEYEDEWRIINTSRANYLQQFPSECLVGITLGCRMEQSEREMIVGWATEAPSRIRISRALTSGTRYGLDFV